MNKYFSKPTLCLLIKICTDIMNPSYPRGHVVYGGHGGCGRRGGLHSLPRTSPHGLHDATGRTTAEKNPQKTKRKIK